MLIRSEIKKLVRNKKIMLFLVFCLALNFIICYFVTPEDNISSYYKAILADYKNDPEKVDTYYKKLQGIDAEYEALYIESIKNDTEIDISEFFPCTYSGIPDVHDYSLLRYFYNNIINADKNYKDKLQNTVKKVRINQREILGSDGFDESSYEYKKQVAIEDNYTEIINKSEALPEYPTGWDSYFNYQISGVFILCFVIIAGCTVYLAEKDGSSLILRSSKKGRLPTGLAKVCTLCFITAFLVISFDLSAFFAILAKCGFSGLSNALGAFEALWSIPYTFKVFEYLLFYEVSRILAYCGIALGVSALSMLLKSRPLCFAVSSSVIGIEYLCFYLFDTEFVKYINVISFCNPTEMLIRFRSVNLFGAVVEYIAIDVFLLILTFLIRAAASVMLFSLRSLTKSESVLSRLVEKWLSKVMAKYKRNSSSKNTAPIGSRSILSFEFRKAFGSYLTVGVVLIMVVLKIIVSANYFAITPNYDDAVYATYMATLEGEITDEKIAFVNNERLFINKTLDEKKNKKEQYLKGEISIDEYSWYIDDYNYAEAHDYILSKIENHIVYAQRMADERNIMPDFVYEIDWLRVFNIGTDWTLLFVLIFVLSGTLADEYANKNGIYPVALIIKCTKHGRNRTFVNKMLTVCASSMCIAILFSLIDLLYMAKNLTLRCFDSALVSIEAFSNVSSDITIKEYMVLMLIARALIMVLLALMSFALGELIRNKTAILCVLVGAIGLTTIGNIVGIPIFKYLDLSSAFGFTDFYLLSQPNKLNYSLIFYPVFLLICAGVVLISKKKYNT